MAPNHEGTHWVRIEQPKEGKIIFKEIECCVDNIWAVDKDNTVWYKAMSNPDYEDNMDRKLLLVVFSACAAAKYALVVNYQF